MQCSAHVVGDIRSDSIPCRHSEFFNGEALGDYCLCYFKEWLSHLAWKVIRQRLFSMYVFNWIR